MKLFHRHLSRDVPDAFLSTGSGTGYCDTDPSDPVPDYDPFRMPVFFEYQYFPVTVESAWFSSELLAQVTWN